MRVYGRTKQGAEYGRLKGKRTLHPMLSTIGTKHSTPVIGPVRLRRGKAADVRGAASFVAEAIATARQAGASGRLLVRADSKSYTAEVVAACQGGASRNICLYICNAELGPDIEIGGREWAWRGAKTPFRAFWRTPPNPNGLGGLRPDPSGMLR